MANFGTFTRSILLPILIFHAFVGARGADVSGRVEMPELCSPAVSPAVVRLEQVGQTTTTAGPTTATPHPHVIDQRGLMFEPRVVAMRVGETLRFGNADPDPHGVRIQGKGVGFNHVVEPGGSVDFIPSGAGIFRVLCDIHTHMRAFVVVGDSPWVVSCSRTGRFLFSEVPDGRYRLLVWHEMGESLTREVEVRGADVDLGTLSAKGGVNPAVLDDRGQICEKGCEPWPLVIDRIAVTLAESLDAAGRPEDSARAGSLVQDAFYRDFESSGMGTAVRVHLGRGAATRVEDLFRVIARTTSHPTTSTGQASPDALGATRQALLVLGKASEDLSRKGVTERSKIFAGTSPAFWVEDPVKKPPAAAHNLTEASSSATIGVLAGLGALLLSGMLLRMFTRAGREGKTRFRVGIVLTSVAVAVTASVLLVNRDQPPVGRANGRPSSARPKSGAAFAPATIKAKSPGPTSLSSPMPREYPVGLEVTKNHLNIAAVWHRAVRDSGGSTVGRGDLHLLAKIQATDGNPNGFAKGDWVPYLQIRYTITPAGGGQPVAGVLRPMVASDGPRYGANLTLPGSGDYHITLRIQPPDDKVFGRFIDANDGVAPWWEPFEVSFDGALNP